MQLLGKIEIDELKILKTILYALCIQKYSLVDLGATEK